MKKPLIALFLGLTLAQLLCAVPSVPNMPPELQRQLFFLLGMNIEYMGRHPGNPEAFYIDEGPVSQLYFSRLKAFVVAANLANESEAIQLVDGLYTKVEEDYDGSPIFFVSRQVFQGYSNEAVLGFFEGAYCRHWKGGCLRFANASHKAELIGSLLVGQDCRDIVVKIYPEYIPVESEVTFVPSEEVKSMMCAMDNEMAEYNGDRQPNKPLETTPDDASQF